MRFGHLKGVRVGEEKGTIRVLRLAGERERRERQIRRRERIASCEPERERNCEVTRNTGEIKKSKREMNSRTNTGESGERERKK